MSDLKERASALLREFKGEAYAFGSGVLDEAPGKFAAEFGKKAMFVGPIGFEWFQPVQERILKSMEKAGVEVVDIVRSAAPNAPFVDVYRIHSHVMHKNPDVLVVADGGRSGLREKLGFQARTEEYGQNALIANVSTAESHRRVMVVEVMGR